MIIRDKTWDLIKDHFSDEEKIQLRDAVTGRVVCPPSISIDSDNLSDALEGKLLDLMAEVTLGS